MIPSYLRDPKGLDRREAGGSESGRRRDNGSRVGGDVATSQRSG